MFEKNEVRDLDLPSQKKFCAQDTSLDVLGKAFVVHGYDGGRIACGTLEYCDPCGPPPPPANVCKPSPFFRIGPPVVGATASEEAVARALSVV